jgi:hypothetical protein
MNDSVTKSPTIVVIHSKLCAPFEIREVKFKPQIIKGDRAMAMAYVDARAIMDRLDDVVGCDGWQDEYEILPDHSVVCRLMVRIGDHWTTKEDVGSPSEQPDAGDRLKAAFSDALKRAAVKFGVGRYLYRLPAQWCDFDPAKKQFASSPKLPAWAMPSQKLTPKPMQNESKRDIPANGEELSRRLCDADAALASKGICKMGEMVGYVLDAGVKAGFGADMKLWTGPAIELAISEARAFRNKITVSNAA